MDNKYQFQNITDKEIRAKGVQALANRPNAAQQYGQSGLSPEALKKWFDQLAELLAKKINELQNAIQGKEATKYIGLDLGEYKTLGDLIAGMESGTFAANGLRLFPNENSPSTATLQDIIYGISQSHSGMVEDLKKIEEDKLDKAEGIPNYRQVYGVGKDGNQQMITVSEAPVPGAVASYSENGTIKTKMSPIEGFPDIENYPAEVVNMAFINEMRKHIGAGVKFTMDPETFVVSVDVLNIEGKEIYHTELDLPLEEFVVDADYEDGKLVVALKSGKIVEIPVATMVNGLVTQSRHEEDIKKINERFEALFNAYVVDVYQLVGGDYVDYS